MIRFDVFQSIVKSTEVLVYNEIHISANLSTSINNGIISYVIKF